jgi:hypothetical protein
MCEVTQIRWVIRDGNIRGGDISDVVISVTMGTEKGRSDESYTEYRYRYGGVPGLLDIDNYTRYLCCRRV